MLLAHLQVRSRLSPTLQCTCIHQASSAVHRRRMVKIYFLCRPSLHLRLRGRVNFRLGVWATVCGYDFTNGDFA